MTSWRLPCTLLLAWALSVAALAQDQNAELNPQQAQRYHSLIQELRCLVCQNQSIADSNAPLANDLRDQVRAQILAGRSDAEIKTYVTDRYGDFVLYRPPVKATTLLLWGGPVFLLLIAAMVAVLHLRRARHAPSAARADPAALKKLLDEQP